MNHIQEFKTYFINAYKIGDIDSNIWMSNYLVDRLEMNENQILWFVFLNSITYHLPTAYMIFNEYPDLELVDEIRIRKWWLEVQSKCPFQKDKLKQRKYLPDTIISYQKLLNGQQQKEFFDQKLSSKCANENFNLLWNVLYKNIKHFGRFSVWNWSQMLNQICGYNITPDTLFLGESNAESHTHGICYALGKYDWAKKDRLKDETGKKIKITHKFTDDEKHFLESESHSIFIELQQNIPATLYEMETVACAFKKMFRTNDSRYLGYYLDRQAEDIKSIENNGFTGVDWSILWDARNEMLNSDFIHKSVDKSKFNLKLIEKILKYDKYTKEDMW